MQEEATAVNGYVCTLYIIGIVDEDAQLAAHGHNAAAICVGAVRLDIGVILQGQGSVQAENAPALQGAVALIVAVADVCTRQGDSTAAVENGAAIVGDIRSEPA